MARGKGGSQYGEEEGQSLGIPLIFLQAILIVVCLANFSLCIWIRFDLDFWEWVIEIGWYTYWNCMYVILVALVIKLIILGAGVWCVWEERAGLLGVLTILHALMIPFHLTGAVLITVYGVEESKILHEELHDVFIRLVYAWDVDPRASRVLRIIMEYVGCCGASGSSDFLDVYKEMPVECRHPITGNEWGSGCEQQMAWWLEPWTATLAASSLFLLIADVLVIRLYMRYRRYLNSQI